MRYLSPIQTRKLGSSLFTDFDDIFESFLQSDLSNQMSFSPRTDIEEHKNHYLLSFDLPGMKEDEINIEVKNNSLVISGERTREAKSDDEKHYKRYERVHGSFMRSFSLPTGLSTDDIEANYENGVLHVLVPKKSTEVSSTVKVQSGKKDGFFNKLLGSE